MVLSLVRVCMHTQVHTHEYARAHTLMHCQCSRLKSQIEFVDFQIYWGNRDKLQAKTVGSL